jgi:hypothetical protein
MKTDGKDKPKWWDFQVFCTKRGTWLRSICQAIIIGCAALGLAAIILSCMALSHSNASIYQKAYFVSHAMDPSILNHALSGPAPVTLSLPNDLTTFVGKLYTIDCETSHAHQVILEAGALPTHWSASSTFRTATCTGGASQRSGFSFRVVSKPHIRIFGDSGMVFS